MNRRLLYLLASIVTAAAGLAIHAGFAQSVSPQKQRVTYFPNRSPLAPYSSAVLVGDTLYVAGVIGLDPKTVAPPGKIEVFRYKRIYIKEFLTHAEYNKGGWKKWL